MDPGRKNIENDSADGGQREEYKKGRGAQFNTRNKYLKTEAVKEHAEGIDDWTEAPVTTQFMEVEAKSLVNKVDSPDVGMWYSMNPYMGCKHGCIYCYARNTHEYWGYSAGLDFESRILVKKNAPQLLRRFLMHPKWECVPISISGNTDCYQPAEKKFGLSFGRVDFTGILTYLHIRCKNNLYKKLANAHGVRLLLHRKINDHATPSITYRHCRMV